MFNQQRDFASHCTKKKIIYAYDFELHCKLWTGLKPDKDFNFSNLQSDVAELSALPKGVHLGDSGIQERLVLEDQISVRSHF